MIAANLAFSLTNINSYGLADGGIVDIKWDDIKAASAGHLGGGFDLGAIYGNANLNWDVQAGLVAQIKVDTGSIAINYVIDPKLETIVNEKTVSLDTSKFSVLNADINTSKSNLGNSSLSVGIDYGAQAFIDAKVVAELTTGVTSPIKQTLIDTKFDLFNIPKSNLELFKINGSNANYEANFNYGSISSKLPSFDGASSASLLKSDDKLGDLAVSSRSNSFLSASLDLDAWRKPP